MNMLTRLNITGLDWYLDKLGITQYTLRNPHVFSGETVLALTPDTRLIILADGISLHLPFFNDILSTLNLAKSSVLIIDPLKAMLLPDNISCVLWVMGTFPPMDLGTKSLAIVHTAPLTELMDSLPHRRLLWQQLCHYGQYFSI